MNKIMDYSGPECVLDATFRWTFIWRVSNFYPGGILLIQISSFPNQPLLFISVLVP